VFLSILSQTGHVNVLAEAESSEITTGAQTYAVFGLKHQRTSFFDGTYWWLFIFNTTGYYYSYSSDPLIWSNAFSQLYTDGFYSRGGLDVAYDGDDGVMVSYGFYSTNYRWIACNGTITGNSISWTRTQLDTYASYYQGLGGDYIPASGKFVYLTHRYDISNPYVVYHNWTYPSGWTPDYQLDLPEAINSNIGGTSVVGGGDIWMNFVMNGGAQLRYSVYDNTLGSVENDAKGGQASFSALPQGSVVHLAYLNSTDDIVYRRYDGSWGDREAVYMGTSDHNSSFPIISLDQTGDSIYVIWADATDDCIYYKKRDSTGESGTWDSTPNLLVDESANGLYSSTKFGTSVAAPEYFNNSVLPVFYVTGTASPFTYKVATLIPNIEPTVTSFTISDLSDGDTMFKTLWYHPVMVVDDEDGISDIGTAYFSFETEYGWHNVSYNYQTDVYAIEAGEDRIAIAEGYTESSGTSLTINFNLMLRESIDVEDNVDVYCRVTDISDADSDWSLEQQDHFNIEDYTVDDESGTTWTRTDPTIEEPEEEIWIDSDGDGIPNSEDDDIDGDWVPNDYDPDMDGDGIPNELDPEPTIPYVEPSKPTLISFKTPDGSVINIINPMYYLKPYQKIIIPFIFLLLLLLLYAIYKSRQNEEENRGKIAPQISTGGYDKIGELRRRR
jgi:hypothetical protein